ncbi:MAG: MBL fold metallo-hydrolase [Candidatus Bathyarchaeia archaeon]
MIVKMFMVGKLLTDCYVAACPKTREAIVIDPGFDNPQEAQEIFKFINQNAIKPKFIINTHGHPDHTCGNGIVKGKFAIPILIHEKDAQMLEEPGRRFAKNFGFNLNTPPADALLQDGDTIKFGETTLKVMHTPGHSQGSICLIGQKEVFTGDTLFAGSIGRVDLPQSSEKDMKSSLKKLASLPDHLKVYPGHGPATTIKEEKQTNPFLLHWL